jgi:PAS domain S-box-containing protein
MPEFGDAERFELLAAVGEVTDGTRLLGETVQGLLDVIVPSFADVATLDVLGATGEMRRLGARVAHPQDAELEAALLVRHQSGDGEVGVLRAIHSSESQLLAPITDETLRAIATSESDLRMLRSLHLRETIYAPLIARGRTLGVLACSTRRTERQFDDDDRRLAEVLASRIGLALDNAGLSQTVSGLERQLEATLANLAAGVIVRDVNGRMVFANGAAAGMLGLSSVEELFAASSEQLMDLFDAYDEEGNRLALSDLPSAKALQGEHPRPLVVQSVRRETGRVRWLLHQATPVFESEGELSLAVNVMEDITENKRAEVAQRILGDAGRELSSSLDYEQTLGRVAELAVPALADWCGVSIVDPGGFLRQVAVAHADPAKLALARAWGERDPTRLDAQAGAAHVIRTGEPQMIAQVNDEVLNAAGASDDQRSLVRAIEMRSVIIVPLAISGQPPFGTLSLVMADSGRNFDPYDLTVAQELGRRAAMAVENARLYTERSRIAATLQHSLLPPELPDIPGFHLASLYRPAGDNEVGGDFYDAFQFGERWLLAVGDVTGHGAEAAALTSLSRHTLRTAVRLLDDPIAAVEQLNAALLEGPQLSLVSLCCVALSIDSDEATAEVLLAGHPPAYHLRGGEQRVVGTQAQLLGFDVRGRWEMAAVRLDPGDLLVLYTDGVIDTFGAEERFGEARLAATLRDPADAADAVARIDTALTAFGHGPQRDDTAVLVVQRLLRPSHKPSRTSGGGGSASGVVLGPQK